MNNLTPNYRILLNHEVTQFPLFFTFLKDQFKVILDARLRTWNLDLTLKYKFTVYSIPSGWGATVVNKIRAYDAGHATSDSKMERISEILHDLDPMNPKPVDLEFTLGEIIKFVCDSVHFYQEVTQGGVLDYFGIEFNRWFDDYPIAVGTVMRAVDMGTLENQPFHLFDTTFEEIRGTILDLFTVFINSQEQVEQKESMVKNNVDI